MREGRDRGWVGFGTGDTVSVGSQLLSCEGFNGDDFQHRGVHPNCARTG
jgi:hypothetical protein